jgi:hypothetical protein
MKTFEVALGIILIVASLALRHRSLWSFFTGEEWHPFQVDPRSPIGTVIGIGLGLALLFGGAFMIWLASR